MQIRRRLGGSFSLRSPGGFVPNLLTFCSLITLQHMSYSLNSLKGLKRGVYRGLLEGLFRGILGV